MQHIDSMTSMIPILWELWKFLISSCQILPYWKGTLPVHSITRGTVQTPGTILETSEHDLCFSPCTVHWISLWSLKTVNCNSSLQYFDRFSPISNDLIKDAVEISIWKKYKIEKVKIISLRGHPSCEYNASYLKKTKNNKTFTQLLDFSDCWHRNSYTDFPSLLWDFEFLNLTAYKLHIWVHPTEKRIILQLKRQKCVYHESTTVSFLL